VRNGGYIFRLEIVLMMALLAGLALALWTPAKAQKPEASAGAGAAGTGPIVGFRGRLHNIQAGSVPLPMATDASGSGDLDPVAMAAWAMNYLVHNPRPQFDYECVFTIYPLVSPPIPLGQADTGPGDVIAERQSGRKAYTGTAHDPITWGDTDSRMDYVFPLMREMSGLRYGQSVEEGLHRRILSYIHPDGMCWLPSGGLFRPGRDYALAWTAGWAMMRLSEEWQRTGNESSKMQAHKLFAGLVRMATRRDGRAWYEGGMNPWVNGEWICENGPEGWTRQPGVTWPVVNYWRITKDPEALTFARELAEGVIHNSQPRLDVHTIQPDGSFAGGNTHLVLHEVLGVAELGALTGDARYTEFARRVYEYVRSLGMDYGWFPEYRVHYGGDLDGETCNTADMIALATCLAEAGYPEYWDHAERYLRNYLRQAQFFVTDEIEHALRAENPQASAADIRKSLDILHGYEGGFNGCFAANSRILPSCRNADARHRMFMSGCCPPSGMYGLYRVWQSIVTQRQKTVYVNVSLNCDVPAAKVVSHLPDEGKITVIAKGAPNERLSYRIRVPAWADRTKVAAYRDGKRLDVAWDGPRNAYVAFDSVKPGTVMSVVYALMTFEQDVAVGGQSGRMSFTLQWRGNTVTGISPRAERFPLFNGFVNPPTLPASLLQHR
jgi:hypothetical protein